MSATISTPTSWRPCTASSLSAWRRLRTGLPAQSERLRRKPGRVCFARRPRSQNPHPLGLRGAISGADRIHRAPDSDQPAPGQPARSHLERIRRLGPVRQLLLCQPVKLVRTSAGAPVSKPALRGRLASLVRFVFTGRAKPTRKSALRSGCSRLPWGQHNPEPNDVRVGGDVVAAPRRAAVVTDAVPIAAADHAGRARNWALWVSHGPGGVGVIPVPAPLPHVPVHVIQTPRVGLVTTRRRRPPQKRNRRARNTDVPYGRVVLSCNHKSSPSLHESHSQS